MRKTSDKHYSECSYFISDLAEEDVGEEEGRNGEYNNQKAHD